MWYSKTKNTTQRRTHGDGHNPVWVIFPQLMSVTRALLGRRGFSLLLRPTVYAQFVAGESESEIAQSMMKMSSLGLRPMLAVPIEEDLGESSG